MYERKIKLSKVRTLVIYEGSEFKIKVEKLEKFNVSFFNEIYNNSAVNVKEIIDNTKEYYIKKENKEFFKDKEEANNIIAFAGERGTGKSSAMVSFTEALKSISKKDINLENKEFEKFRALQGNSFVNLEIIDPALLEDKESIFEIIIAKMFAKFKERLQKDDDMEFDDKKRLLKKFQRVYEDLKVINTDRKDFFKESASSEDIIGTLVNLASGSNMRKNFIELVNEFLGFFSDSKEKQKRFLVIPIDDLDMNIKHSAEMAEQIRKYLMVPNVIILMAVKIEQLKDSIEQMYIENYETMFKHNRLTDDPKEMAERYIEKLIPNGRKLFLPEIRTTKGGREEEIRLLFQKGEERNSKFERENDGLIHKLIEVKERKNGKIISRIVHEKSDDENYNTEYTKESGEVLSIEETVLKMTYKKTGLIFIKPEYDIHYLVPDNLRELQNYLIMLNKMKDINIESDIESDIEERLKNIEKFETYFLKTWINRNLSKKYVDLVEEFYHISFDRMNKFIIMKLRDIVQDSMLKDEISNANNKSKVFDNQIFSRGNFRANVSIGDVLEALSIYDDCDNEKIKKFKFAIKTIYSLTIYRLLYTDDKGVTRLIGGNIFGEFEEDKITLKLDTYPEIITDNNKNMDYTVSFIIKKILDNLQNGSLEEKEEIENRVKIMEWINYFIQLRSLELNKMGNKYRENKMPYYSIISNLGCGSIQIKRARFNMLTFISSLIDPIQNLEKIFLGRIELELNSKDYFKSDNSIITVQDILKEVKEYSMYNAIDKWQKKYRVALPIYSMEIIEYIRGVLKTKIDKKFKGAKEPYYEKQFKRMLNIVIPEIIKDIKKDNNFLVDENNNCLFEKAYKKCPIIDVVINNQKKEGKKELIENRSIVNIINDAYENSEEQNRYLQLIQKRYSSSIEYKKNTIVILNKHISYFKKWIEKIVTVNTIKQRINDIKAIEYKFSINFYSKFNTIHEELKKMLEDKNIDTIVQKIDICKNALSVIEYEIKLLEKEITEQKIGSEI